MERIITVSNRLPVTICRKNDQLSFSQSAGGLATALTNVTGNEKNLWIGWAGIASEELSGVENEIETELRKRNLEGISLTRKEIELFYEGFSNTTVWPLFHYFPKYTFYFPEQWYKYIEVNQKFADKIIAIAVENDIIWIHDYHLMLVPAMVRKALPHAKIAYFQHIPFPSFEIFRILPCREEILNGLLGADLIGFHTHDDVKHFLDSVNRIRGLDNVMGEIRNDQKITQVDAFPLGIDYDFFESLSVSEITHKQIEKYKAELNSEKLILSIDRLDYSKGISERLQAFEVFLEKYPEYIEEVTLIMIVVPSREKVPLYKNLKTEIDELVGKINGRFRTIKWTPVVYMYRSYPLQDLSAFYQMADVALITPLRDGMNLVCKEYIASRKENTGVLILSEMAGASKELYDAIIINPYNIDEVAEAIKDALSLPWHDQSGRISEMKSLLKKYTSTHWCQIFLEKLNSVYSRQVELTMRVFTPAIESGIIKDFLKAKKRILLLDYDGTLVPIKEKPDMARPDKELYGLLEYLNRIPDTEVVLVSGRDQRTMQEWFCDLSLEIIAEHGAHHRKDNVWNKRYTMSDNWKEKVRSILQLFVNRTPGSFIEEKVSTLAWHYRKADTDLAMARVRELLDYLQYFTKSMKLSILEGKKVVEIKPAFFSKGTVVKERVSNMYDFILCAGDDWTDEDMFRELPDYAHSLKVGFVPSHAKYNIQSCDDAACMEIRKFLKTLISEIIENSAAK